MGKNKIAVKILSILDRFEDFSKIINKRLNGNKLSRKIESIITKKLKISQLISLDGIVRKTKYILNKKIQLPDWFTADSFSKGIRLYIKSKFGITSSKIDSKTIKKEYGSTIQLKKSNFLDKLNIFKLLSTYSKIKNNKINSKSIRNIISKLTLYPSIIKLAKNINLSRVNKKRKSKIRIEKTAQIIAVAFFGDHLLTVARISINSSNQILVLGVVEVPIPGHIIGDNFVEDTSELANIILDLFNLLDLNQSPLLVILSSAFFKVHTFDSSELKQISNTDSTVQAKSPYLPGETFVEFRSMSKKSAQNKLLRTVYSRRRLIESWTDTLEIINVPIIGLTPAAPHVFDSLISKSSDKIAILIDIEINSTSVLIGNKSGSLTSHKLPYGCSLYVSDQSYDLSTNYFNRVLSSIELIMSEYDEKLPSIIFVIGQGLNSLTKNDMQLPPSFKRFSEMNLVDYSYNPLKMEIHELVSKSIDSTIDTLSSITSLCL